MITRAYITKIKPGYAQVRAPLLHGWDPSSSNYIPDTELPWASISAIPGIDVTYKPEDVVLIGFQDSDAGRPLVLGHLKSALQELDINDQPSITASNLEVSSYVKLPKNIKIGNLTYNDLVNNTNSADIRSITNADIDNLFE